MHLDDLLTDDAALAELGARLARQRVARNLTQADLAERAGVGRATLQRLERGESVQVLSLIKVLRVLDLLTALDAVVPESADLPIAQLARELRPRRRRARDGATTPPRPDAPPWTWGDEPA
jgi:transcriptional regulator with XRE-family HTH domain